MMIHVIILKNYIIITKSGEINDSTFNKNAA